MELIHKDQPEANTQESEKIHKMVMGWMNIPFLYHSKSFDTFQGRFELIERSINALEKGRGVFYTGGCGTGKTHLAVSLMMDYAKKNRTLSPKQLPKFLPAVELFLELKDTFGNQSSEKSIIDKYSAVEILCIDDVGAEKVSDWTRQAFYTLIDRRYRDLKRTILTSNLDLDKIAQNIDDRISSRIVEMCEIIELTGTDYRLKLRA